MKQSARMYMLRPFLPYSFSHKMTPQRTVPIHLHRRSPHRLTPVFPESPLVTSSTTDRPTLSKGSHQSPHAECTHAALQRSSSRRLHSDQSIDCNTDNFRFQLISIILVSLSVPQITRYASSIFYSTCRAFKSADITHCF